MKSLKNVYKIFSYTNFITFFMIFKKKFRQWAAMSVNMDRSPAIEEINPCVQWLQLLKQKADETGSLRMSNEILGI